MERVAWVIPQATLFLSVFSLLQGLQRHEDVFRIRGFQRNRVHCFFSFYKNSEFRFAFLNVVQNSFDRAIQTRGLKVLQSHCAVLRDGGMVALSAEIPAILLRQRWLSKQLIPGARIRRYMELCQRANRFCPNKGAELVLGRLIAMPTIVGTVTLATAANELSNQLAVFELLHRAVLDEPSVLVGQGVNLRTLKLNNATDRVLQSVALLAYFRFPKNLRCPSTRRRGILSKPRGLLPTVRRSRPCVSHGYRAPPARESGLHS